MWKAATALAKAWQLQDWFFFSYKRVRWQACPDRAVPGGSTSLPSKLLIPCHLPTRKGIYSPQKAMRHLITHYQQGVTLQLAGSVQGGWPWGNWVHGKGGDLRCLSTSFIWRLFIHVFQAFSDEIIHHWYHFCKQYCLPEASCVACPVLWCCQTRVNARFNAFFFACDALSFRARSRCNFKITAVAAILLLMILFHG